MISRKIRGRIALSIAAVLLLTALAAVLCLWQMSTSANPEPSPNADEQVYDDGFPVIDWDYWRSINPDIIGWVTVPGTNIDSPIVQAHADDPGYYLHHDIYKNYNVYGCPYLDADCEESGFDSQNAVIFGHHMNDQTVFSAFASYSDKAFATEHNRILLQSPEGKVVLAPKFVDVVNAYVEKTKRTDFTDLNDFNSWYQERAESAVMILDTATPTHNFTFVTCSYSRWQNERTLVFASK